MLSNFKCISILFDQQIYKKIYIYYMACDAMCLDWM